MAARRIDDEITTRDGFTFVVVDLVEYGEQTEYVVRSDRDGNDWACREGVEGVDWEYVYIPAADVVP